MHTIFVPIVGRQQARNILRTGVFSFLTKNQNIQLVLFVPEFKLSHYEHEFQSANVIFEKLPPMCGHISHIDAFFGRIALFYINSHTARFLRKEWLLLEQRKPIRYVSSMILLWIFGSLSVLRSITRYCDFLFVKDDRFEDYFKTYTPTLVFLPRIDVEADRSLLRYAKKHNIKTIGMINSWDNISLSKYPFRILPDKLIVHNEIIKKDALTYLDMPSEHVYISGMPHFDRYVTEKRSSRESFCKKLGIDPSKRMILFASIGSVLNPTEYQVLSMLDRAMNEGRLPSDVIIIFRLHPTEKTHIDKEKYSTRVVFDDSKTTVSGDKEYTEILAQDSHHLGDSLFHTEMTIATASTMTIDAAAFDKPSINVAFDGWEKKAFHESVRRFYAPSHEHYQPIVHSGGVRIAYTFDELVGYITMYLKDKTIDRAGRTRMVKEQCYTLDGKSGERIATFILDNLK